MKDFKEVLENAINSCATGNSSFELISRPNRNKVAVMVLAKNDDDRILSQLEEWLNTANRSSFSDGLWSIVLSTYHQLKYRNENPLPSEDAADVYELYYDDFSIRINDRIFVLVISEIFNGYDIFSFASLTDKDSDSNHDSTHRFYSRINSVEKRFNHLEDYFCNRLFRIPLQ